MIEVIAHMNDKSHIAAMKRLAPAVPKGPPVAHTNDAVENEEATNMSKRIAVGTSKCLKLAAK